MRGTTAPEALGGERERAELTSLLASAAFGRSPRLARLLKYLCNKSFEGQADQIKEYNIAVDVLDRPESFDPTEDAIARVEVHRLRKKLREYYETEGAGHAVRIVIPAGRYGPVFMTDAHPASDDAIFTTSEGESVVHVNGSVLSSQRERPSDAWLVSRYLKFLAVAVVTFVAIFILWARLRPAMVTDSGHAAAVMASTIPTQPAVAFPSGAVSGDAIRILCGRRKPHIDPAGRVWPSDQYFEGGEYWDAPKVFLARTSDLLLYDGARTGAFSYNIPLQPGVYELHLYFAETTFGPSTTAGGGENSRVFHVALNGKRILSDFDIVSDAGGPAIADERVFKDVSPATDGMVHIRFMSQRSQAMVSAIRLEPAAQHHLNPSRILCQDKPYKDSQGSIWMPDDFWSGGQIGSNGATVKSTRDPNLYTKERYGHFSYAIPADDGEYAVTLHFAEKFWGLENPGGGGEGDRVFDVFCNGVALIRNLDMYKEAGANHALLQTFHGLKPNAQGKLLLSFVPVRNYASLYAIEVVDEAP